MATSHGAVTGHTEHPRARVAGHYFPGRLFVRSASAVTRMLAGSCSVYRSYQRETFPEYEQHQIVAGRKDRFDGPM